ncbi:MAG: monofunctional biosynthetic peptidoglycan transglycosylase [Gammaproteobacteria bacterium]|nr:monofunctional biosynthetic peptidoglycan transglycosylase [Gammaproteobacteria bacterium]
MAKKRPTKQSWQRIRQHWQKFVAMFPRIAQAIRWGVRIFLVVILLDIGYLIGIWPEWKWYVSGDIPKSRFIHAYERESSQNPNLPRLRWRPVGFDHIPTSMLQAVLAAEDSRFFEHSGIDTEAFRKAMEYNWQRKAFVYGASTISQQTVKNLFLTGSRNPFRKVHELLLTFSMENNLKKKRILEIYLNVAEFGTGLYGIDAASRFYFGVPASMMSQIQAVELAATLPAPTRHNPRKRTAFFMKQRAKIKGNLGL